MPPSAVAIGSSGDEPITFRRFAEARFAAGGGEHALELYWLEGYGGGLFLPFRDATAASETYGGGRYLLDTVKGADLGMDGGRLVLDFNFAYNPSCSYDPGWVCPLSPPANSLPIAIRAGERHSAGTELTDRQRLARPALSGLVLDRPFRRCGSSTSSPEARRPSARAWSRRSPRRP